MRVAVVLLLIAACHEPGKLPQEPPTPIVDAAVLVDSLSCLDPVSRSSGCDPIVQVGCVGSERCAIVRIPDESVTFIVTCLDQGSVPIGGDCTWTEIDNAPTCPRALFDNCTGRGVCTEEGVCRTVCWVGDDVCPVGTCVHDPFLFSNPHTQNWGVCRE
jgi:hypothetical protein